MKRIEISAFSLSAFRADASDRLWRRGGFARAYLADDRDRGFATTPSTALPDWRRHRVQKRDTPKARQRSHLIANDR
jgi:hypothetical protein